MTDARDGSMTGISGPMPAAQGEAFAMAPVDWADIPLGRDYDRIGAVHSALLRSLKDRGLVETRWHKGVQQWRRTDGKAPDTEASAEPKA